MRAPVERWLGTSTDRRRALRAALVVPPVFAVALTVGSDAAALYALFGAFSQLVFGDYGGPTRRRVEAYLTTTVAGAALILAGTVVSRNVVLAAVGTFVVGAGLTLVGALGVLARQLRLPLLLAFVLAATTPVTISGAGPRIAGWVGAGIVVLAAALVVVPRRDGLLVTGLAAAACDELATAVGAGGVLPAPGAVQALRAAHDQTGPTAFGPGSRARAMLLLVLELHAFARTLTAITPAERPQLDGALGQSVGRALAACAAALRGDGPRPDLGQLDRARVEHRTRVEQQASEALAAGRSASSVVDAMDATHRIRLLSHEALSIAASVTVVGGAPLPDTWLDRAPRLPDAGGAVGTLGRARRELRANLRFDSVRFRDSVRAGAAFALAVAVADIGDFQHSFWVVFGALTVLRTTALAGSRTAVGAVTGTALGFLAVLPVVWLADPHPVVVWSVLVVTTLLAAFASGALPFALGQGAFTVFVVTAVNLVEPDGWHTGAVRVSDVFVGALVAVGANILFWPRGARSQARRLLSAAFAVVADELQAALGVAFGRPATDPSDAPDSARARSEVLGGLDRARVAVEDLVAERGRQSADAAAAAELLVTASALHAVSQRALTRMAGDPSGAVAPVGVVEAATAAVGAVRAVGVALSARHEPAPVDSDAIARERRQATAAALGEPGPPPFDVVWAGQWLVDIARAAQRQRPQVATLSAV